MNGRIYDPLIGRFLSADVLVEDPSNLQCFNRYSYVRNNPLSANDPSGHVANFVVGFVTGFVTDVAIQAATNYVTGKPIGDIKYGQAVVSGGLTAAGVGVGKLGKNAYNAYKQYKNLKNAQRVARVEKGVIVFDKVGDATRVAAKETLVERVKNAAVIAVAVQVVKKVANYVEGEIKESIGSSGGETPNPESSGQSDQTVASATSAAADEAEGNGNLEGQNQPSGDGADETPEWEFADSAEGGVDPSKLEYRSDGIPYNTHIVMNGQNVVVTPVDGAGKDWVYVYPPPEEEKRN